MPRCVAFIPARGGSKRVPGKNLREVGGVSLVGRACDAAVQAGIHHVVVSSDDDAILNDSSGAEGGRWQPMRYERHHRPPQLATDHAQIETAIAHWWHRLDDKPDVIVLLQPTSPFRTAAHVREALRLLEATGADSVVGVTVGHEHHFAGRLKPREFCRSGAILYDTEERARWFDFAPFRDVSGDRPRTQDLRPMGAENGSLYAFTRAHWERTGNRMGGHMVALPMDRWSGLDIDDETDLAVANALCAAGVCR